MRTATTLAAGVLSAIGATACCFGPLLPVTLGFGGAWAGRLQSLAPFQPAFAALTLAFMGFAFHRLYVAPRRCAAGEACALPQVLRRQRVGFWIIATLILVMALAPFLSPLFY